MNLKVHKYPLLCRFIASSTRTPLKQLSIAINTALNALRHYLDAFWAQAFKDFDAPQWVTQTRCRILNNSSELAQLTELHNQHTRHSPNIQATTHDFSTLYTKLSLLDLNTRMRRLIKMLWGHIAHNTHTTENQLLLFVDTIHNRTEWTTDDKKPLKTNQFLLTAKSLAGWISVLTFNTCVSHNNSLYKQIIGLPMGTNAAVNLANFTLYSYEYDHLISCLLRADYTTLHALHYQKRYLDDIITLNNSDFDSFKYDIYPEDTLTLDLEQDSLPLHCLDFHFYYNKPRNRLSFSLHSKQNDPKFKSLPHTHYPHPDSFISPAILYNTYTGELHRHLRNNSSFHSFTHTVRALTQQLLNKSYNYKRLKSKLNNFIRQNRPIYNQVRTPSNLTALIFSTLTNTSSSGSINKLDK